MIINEDWTRLENICDNATHKTIWALLRLTGCKIGEALCLRVQDVYDQGEVKEYIRFSSRIIPICSLLREYLQAYNPPLSGYLFPSPKTSSHISYDAVLKFLQKKAKMAGIRGDISTHNIRQSCLSELARISDLQTVRQIAGISSLQNIQTYLETDGNRVRSALERLATPDKVSRIPS